MSSFDAGLNIKGPFAFTGDETVLFAIAYEKLLMVSFAGSPMGESNYILDRANQYQRSWVRLDLLSQYSNPWITGAHKHLYPKHLGVLSSSVQMLGIIRNPYVLSPGAYVR